MQVRISEIIVETLRGDYLERSRKAQGITIGCVRRITNNPLKKLRWQILVVAVTIVIVALLLLSQQPISIITLPEAAQGGIYTEALIGSLGRLNPMLDWNNSADRDINRLIFSGLIKFDSHGLPQPDLAESWGTSADGILYNFSLRPNALWHDGQPVTSDDVIFTIELIKSAGSLFPQDIK
ncbi:MAG: ABC transporter substrate-binding protein, partial [Anaerolineales bacterium]|nr:ABC transporter substrate-binding protein [Anaerolineales bacterium]